jgi:hypothetical protein
MKYSEDAKHPTVLHTLEKGYIRLSPISAWEMNFPGELDL